MFTQFSLLASIQDQYFNLLTNAAFVLSLTSLYVFFPVVKLQKSVIIRIVTGLVFGLTTILLMKTTVNIGNGALIDARMVIINIAYLFFGPIVGSISLVITAIFRISLGGVGVSTGVTGLILNALITVIYKKYRFLKIRHNKIQRLIEVFLLAFIIRALYLFTAYLLLPSATSEVLIREYSVWLLIAYPLLTVFFAQILFFSDDVFQKNRMLIESQNSFVLAIENSPYPIALFDEDGTIISLNKIWLKSTGYESGKFQNAKEWVEVAYIEEEATRLLTRLENKNFSNLSTEDGERKIKTKTGEVLIWRLKREHIGVLPNGKQGYLTIAIDVTHKKQLENQLYYDSVHDFLTKLYNRRFLDYLLSDILSDSEEYYIIFFDLNELKKINDKHGHFVGDQVLVDFAEVIQKNIGTSDYAFRLSGDEFLIILPVLNRNCDELVNNIKNDLHEISDKGISISTSYGYSKCKNIKNNFDKAFVEAEDEMYQNKTINSHSVRGMSINGIMETLKEKDEYTNFHSENVSRFASDIAIELGLSRTEIEEIRKVALLHDIGKILLPASILNSTGKLEVLEYEEIKRHPEIGYRILKSDSSTEKIAEYVLYHHERMDGKGYPKGISGDDIPLQSKIIAIADSFDAMTSDRSYRHKLTVEMAILELKEHSGTQFDSNLVEKFIKTLT